MTGTRMLSFSVDALLGRQVTKGVDITSPWKSNNENDVCSRETQKPTPPEVTPLTGSPCVPDRTSPDDKIQVELYCKELWQQFYRLGNEMIITKAGRRMFPALKIKVSGLDPEAYYILWVDVVSVDDNRYRYVYPNSQWMVAGTGDPPLPQRHYAHADSPATGRHWMAQFISFDRLKLTNNKQPQAKGQVSLHSMHKYQPQIHILRTTDLHTEAELQMDSSKSTRFTFKETSFITVTAYQNQQITRLKIASNPFAKGFRDTGKTREECYSQHRPRNNARAITEYSGLPSLQIHHHHINQVPYPYLLSSPHPTYCAPTPTYNTCCPLETCGHPIQSPNFPFPPPSWYLVAPGSRTQDQKCMYTPYPKVEDAVLPSVSAIPNQTWPFVPGVYPSMDYVAKM